MPYITTLFNRDNFYSDHLPITVEFDLDERKNKVKILSWNIMGAAHGNAAKWEPLQQNNDQELRYERIAEILKSSDADIIALQEVLHDQDYNYGNILLKKLGADWALMNSGEQITLYKKSRFKLNESASKINKGWENRFITSPLEVLDTDTLLVVNNVWSQYYFCPETHHSNYTSLLRKKIGTFKNQINLVIGDTNSRLAPTDEQKKLITTGVVPTSLAALAGVNNPNIMLEDYPDGALISRNGREIQQLSHTVLFVNENQEFQTVDSLDAQPEGDENDSFFRPIITLDPRHKAKEQGLPVFNQDLSPYGVKGVYLSADHFNNYGVTLTFDRQSETYHELVKQYQQDNTFHFVREQMTAQDTYDHVLSLPIERAAILDKRFFDQVLLNNPEILQRSIISALDKQIDQLNASRLFFFSGADKARSLQQLRTKISKITINECTGKEDFKAVIKHWENEPTDSGKTNHEVVTQHRLFFLAFLSSEDTSTANCITNWKNIL